ncbi:sigma 54-interacting transcriptional regulator [Tepidibacillus sp. LV47]|uniref:sigma 54-interacting transcriptional regulator n=1 Tax=Tepidibacillus sp. LV47 TaxID=3398228 RepID=UPI003AACCAA0
MRRIDLVYKKLSELAKDKGITAKDIADSLGLSRANVSSDLNQLWKEGKIEKTKSRPVLFHLKESKRNKHDTTLDKFVSINKSLTTAVEQAKAAILYPPKGMHSLILGETGVGKTMFAGLMHTYAIEIGKLKKDAPFVTFNCADYANNPQLLISQLFGVKKGAYTGADSDRIGLIEKANDGILFLDEVHRLPAEGQEMFFTFMDKGIYRRLGETDVERAANVLIISATTESPESTLLKTFTRRIPMIINLSPLRERSLEERLNLITSFFREESFRLGQDIKVSTNSLRAFLSYHCPNNIGQLKTDIQLACAKAYADFVSKKKESIKINSTDLPNYVKEGLLIAKKNRHIIDKLIGLDNKYYLFDPNHENFSVETEKYTENIYEMIDSKIHELRQRGIDEKELDMIMENDIENFFAKYILGVKEKIEQKDISNVIDSNIIHLVEQIVEYAEKKLNKGLSQKVFLGLAFHIQSSIERIRRGKKIINPQLNKVRIKYKNEFNLALECVKMIEETLQIDLPIDEVGFLTMFFVLDEKDVEETKQSVGIAVITHGNGISKGMVEVAHRLLGTKYATSIDMPLDQNPQVVLEQLKKQIKDENRKAGYLFLVDMGSLLAFGDMVEEDTGVPIKVVPFVSTLHVVEAVRKAMLGYSLEKIYKDVINITQFDILNSQEIRNNNSLSKLAIITACLTGEGSALMIKNILQSHLKFDKQLLEIIPINIVGKEDIKLRIKKLKSQKNILCVISNFNIDDNIPEFSIEEVLNLKAINSIQHLIDIEQAFSKMGETLKYHMKYVNGDTVLPNIRKTIVEIENNLGLKVNRDNLIGIALHMSVMVDRLKSEETIVEYKDSQKYITNHQHLYVVVKNALKSLEQIYDIEIPDDEICYIMNFFDVKKVQEGVDYYV